MVKSFANEDIENEKFKVGNDAFLDAKKNSYHYMGGYNSGLTAFNTCLLYTSLSALIVAFPLGCNPPFALGLRLLKFMLINYLKCLGILAMLRS